MVYIYKSISKSITKLNSLCSSYARASSRFLRYLQQVASDIILAACLLYYVFTGNSLITVNSTKQQ
jgi:hypothetical protein